MSGSSLGRYRFYLRHLLFWAGETPFQQAAKLRPTFPSYVSNLPGRQGDAPLAPVTQKKIIEAGKRLLVWAKQNHPKEFGSLSSTWLESLRPPWGRKSSTEHEYVSLEEILQLVAVPHEEDDLALLRDKAATAMLILPVQERAPSPPCPSQQWTYRAEPYASGRSLAGQPRMANAPRLSCCLFRSFYL